MIQEQYKIRNPALKHVVQIVKWGNEFRGQGSWVGFRRCGRFNERRRSF